MSAQSDGTRRKAVLRLVAMYGRRVVIAKDTMLKGTMFWYDSDEKRQEMSAKLQLLTKEPDEHKQKRCCKKQQERYCR